MNHICHISTSTIRPSGYNDELTRRKIELTPWDLRLIRINYIQKGLLFNKPAAENQSSSVVEHLQATLSLTLKIFYPLAGRLAVTESEDKTSTCVFIDCNGEGAHFVHAVADGVAVADILDSIYVPDDIVSKLFSMNEVQNFEGVSKPLLAAQVTELVDGIFIACSINHAVMDGTSFWHFFNTWSEISRSYGSGFEYKISQLAPVFDRHEFFHGLIDLPIHLPFSFNEIMGKRPIVPSTESLKRAVFHFPKEKVAELKSKANAETGTNYNKISSLQAVMGHIWRAVTRARNLNPGQEVMYRAAVGMRQKLKPALPTQYIGNALLGVFVKSTAGELLQHGLGWAALQINEGIASMTAEEASKFMEDWVKNPTILPNKKSRPTIAMLHSGSSPRFNVYGNDFGWGRPIAVRSGPVERRDGWLIVFPGAEEQGSIDVEACLLPEVLQAMPEDKEFMEALLT